MSSAPALIVAAVVLVPVAGVFAAVDSAFNTVSRARVEDMVKDERPGSVGLLGLIADRPRYVNLTV
ncbi:MAG: hypothetical protein WBQ44_09840, partial [Rhodococcus sp. (in: high G+C Gram-positive bacteria)]